MHEFKAVICLSSYLKYKLMLTFPFEKKTSEIPLIYKMCRNKKGVTILSLTQLKRETNNRK